MAAPEMSVAVRPKRWARSVLTVTTVSGPLPTMPVLSSTTPGTWVITSSTLFARSARVWVSSPKILTSTGRGEPAMSPTLSWRIWPKSTWAAGTWAVIWVRTSSMTSLMSRERLSLSRTDMSPMFWEVRSKPSCAPVRRDQAAISGVWARMASIFRQAASVSARDVPAGSW